MSETCVLHVFQTCITGSDWDSVGPWAIGTYYRKMAH